MSPQLPRSIRLHLQWLLLTLTVALICWGLYEFRNQGNRPGGGTPSGYVLGIVGFGLIVFASCYAVRRRLRPTRLRDTIGKRDPGREQRLARLNESIADLQVAGINRGDMATDLLTAANGAIAEAGFREQIQVEALTDESGRPVVRLMPREHPGRLENWLIAHQYLGVLILFLVLWHAAFQFRGTLAIIVTLLTFLTVINGMAGSVLYRIVPRLLVRLEASGSSGGVGATVLNGVLVVWRYTHVALTGALLGAVLVHILSVMYY